MKVKRGFKSWILIASCFLFFTSCITYKEVEFKGINDVSIGDIKSQKTPIQLDVKVHNPNNYNIKITKVNLDLYIEGKHFGKTRSSKKVVIKKNQELDYVIVLETSKSEIGKSLFSSLAILLGKKLTLEIKGTVVAKAYGIKKKFPVNEKHILNPSDFM